MSNPANLIASLNRREFFMGAAATSALAFAGSLVPTQANAAPTGTLRIALTSLTDQSVDPFFQGGGLARPIGYSLYNALFRFDDKGQIEFDLAESMDISADRKTVTFKIRGDVEFWDGTPMTAEDVAWSWEAFSTRNPPQPQVPGLKRQIESVVATDARTVVMKLFNPTPMRTAEFTIWWNVSSKAHFARVGPEAFRTQPMGTGPFKLVRNQIGAFIEMEANERHYRKDRISSVKTVRMNVVPEVTTRIAQLRAGEVDIIDGITGVQGMQIAADPNLKLFRAPETAIMKVNYFDVQRGLKPWNDIRFREALTISVNQDEIVRGLLRQGTPSPNAHVFPASKGFDARQFAVRKYDPDRAKRLIKEAGVEGFEFDLMAYPSGSYANLPEIAQAVAGYWGGIGLKPKVVMLEASTYISRLVNRQLSGAGIQSIAFENDLRTTAGWLITGAQWGSTDNVPELNAMHAEMRAETDTDKQIAIAQRMHKFCYDNFLFGTGPWSNSQWAATRKVTEWVRPAGDPYTTRLESVKLA
jgi:peptide/nickel transport system substrate-binding protein